MNKLYIERMQSAIPFMPPHLYDSPEGRLRLAREIGGSLADSEPESAKYQMRISYDILLKATGLKPIIDKKPGIQLNIIDQSIINFDNLSVEYI